MHPSACNHQLWQTNGKELNYSFLNISNDPIDWTLTKKRKKKKFFLKWSKPAELNAFYCLICLMCVMMKRYPITACHVAQDE